ncbi:MAG: RNA pseudouridine synthase [Desulfobulbaceae bacterium]|jgi:tRNA pseudouridine32 synthase/23S rRNA pseudouridine746 synthase|nr:RNA pseudouridine synthase [Desulfobulbaceae bacterium]
MSHSLLPTQPFPPAKTWRWPIAEPAPVLDFLAASTGLGENALRDCLEKGGVWLKRPGQGERRVRKGKFLLWAGDRLALCYDARLLAMAALHAICLYNQGRYSVWEKPALMLSQGSRFGDHCSLLRQVEKTFPNKTIHLVHRLDREARGVMLFAHDRQAAAAFSRLFQSRAVEKRYRARVAGRLATVGETVRIDTPLDGKEALTEATVLTQDAATSLLDVRIATGRLHQIRRHLAGLGHPLLGDRRYNRRCRREALQLVAWLLAFTCPFSGEEKRYQLAPPELLDILTTR